MQRSTMNSVARETIFKPGQLVKLANGHTARVIKPSYKGDLKARVRDGYADLEGSDILPSWAAEDLDYDACVRAHRGTSWSPELRGYLHFNDYDADLAKVREVTDDEDFARFRKRYKAMYRDYLHSMSNVTSAFVTGGSGRNTARESKRSRWADNKRKALEAYLEKWLKPKNVSTAIFADDPDAVEKLEQKLAAAQAKQEKMKRVNKLYRAFKKKGEAALEGCELDEDLKELIRTFVPQYSWIKGPYAPYTLTNNSANIRRMKTRLEELKAAPTETLMKDSGVDGVELVENAELVRVQLKFSGKPPKETRTLLKKNGFRWAPSQDAWQRQLTDNGRRAAQRVLETLRAA